MICLGYFSSAAGELTAEALSDILSLSQRKNAASGVTGLLCHYDGSFLQFLEGQKEVVLDTYARIIADPRHVGLIEVCNRPISERAFGDWSMGVVDVHAMGVAEQQFCRVLRELRVPPEASHHRTLRPFLEVFMSSVR